MSFPEESKASMAFITASKTTYNNPDKWTGGSPDEITFQHKNTLIALYDIPIGTTSEHIDGFFPANLAQRIIDNSGCIICKAGDTYIGCYPLEFTFLYKRILNGSEIDLSKYKLFERPFLNAEVSSQKLTVTYKDMKLVLDFDYLEKKSKK